MYCTLAILALRQPEAAHSRLTRPLRFSDVEHTHITARARCDGSATPRSAGHALEPCAQAPKTACEGRRPPRAAAWEPCDHRGRGAAAATAQRFTSRIRRAGDVHGEVDVSPDNDNSRATGSRLRSCYRPTTNGRTRDAKHAARAKNVSRVDRGAKTQQWNFSKNREISPPHRSL